MTDTTDREMAGRTDEGIRTMPEDGNAVEAVGTYETDDAVVFYDTENPLAWIQSEGARPLEEMT